MAKVYAEKEHTIKKKSTGVILSVVKGGLHAAKKLQVDNSEGLSTQVSVSPVVSPTSAIHLFLSLKNDENISNIDGKLDKILKELSSMKTEIREGSLRVEKTIEKLVAFIAEFVSSTTQPPPQ
ncbi:hypothetical protein PHYBLDRAFT_139419 [Phycomyces blakesleeanus NRRL 1555(-)]|uniref:Uncharacterized protein n=1 Tax=Phycomyces blakesleeanus (strain ATCC 8743b / DSM 1359 / FGSC 10004 / NBRC 33097 / NRRL 1555) TaxID=763407 RepID=A0A167QAW2_PHYB8|nr:hypothetical protein PHYBLDRAFT_139419 [Phycomyces blakesleeanus NRRL 1555(-)]OAD79388.1 hypothetical protein PHYBLDRAFT_139419 [Phycomyces blakesleeanus NRRL 1555(-)]|eukprot:XP_018297428.1 hypothetical protein PHYBLDRAFT_139419 [Phycomyces blakesleeanus NRRL 1555(-)]